MSEEKARLFIALELPEVIRVELSDWTRAAVGQGEGMRPLAPEALHVTLCFLGWRELDAAPRLAELVGSCARPVTRVRTTGAAWLPPRRPRVLAIDLEDADGALGGLQACVSDALSAGAGYEPEKRPYRPHVTVARVARGLGRGPRLTTPPQLALHGEALVLYRSHLGRAGARYEALARIALPAG